MTPAALKASINAAELAKPFAPRTPSYFQGGGYHAIGTCAMVWRAADMILADR